MLADIGSTQLFYETVGRGTTMLVMHGGLGLDHTYLRTHDALADAYRLHRANGRSPRGDAPMVDHATWHADAAALLDYLGEQRAIIYGHSYGAWLALGFALRYPERVRALVLCGAAPAFDYMDQVSARVARADPALAARFAAALAMTDATDAQYGETGLSILPLYFHGPARVDAFAKTRYSATGYLLGAACMATYNVLARVNELRAPTLLLQGTHDFITPSAQARRIPGDFVELAASGHFPFLEKPGDYVVALQQWLQDQSTT